MQLNTLNPLMIEFDYIDHRCREVKPQVAKLSPYGILLGYIIIGTDYGYVHTTAGDIRLWKTYSGAYKWLRKNYGKNSS